MVLYLVLYLVTSLLIIVLALLLLLLGHRVLEVLVLLCHWGAGY